MPHIHDKIDFCSETFIVYKDTVLLRKHDKLKIWLSVGGHIELDEDPNEAAIREVREEVGLDVELYSEENKQPVFKSDLKSLIPPQYLNRHNITDEHEHVEFVYFAKSKTDKLQLSDTEITDECKWFTREELVKNDHGIPGDVQLYALEALEKLSENPAGETGLKKDVIKKDVFDREITLCKNLAKENGNKCNWGSCEKCGVLPLLIKLHEGRLLEDSDEIVEVKNKTIF